MSAESELFQALDVPTVATHLAERIYPDFLPEGATLPAVVYGRSATNPVVSIGSVHFADFVDFTVTVWGKPPRAGVDAAADAVEVSLRLAGHNVTGREAGADPETGLLATTINVTVMALA